MNEPILVDFHCHSDISDGEQTPEALAASLALAGVRFAALTDHNSLEGLPRFTQALKKHGIVNVPGLELTTWLNNREFHLLAFGFDPEDPELAATLYSLRQVHEPQVHSIVGSLRTKGAHRHTVTDDVPTTSAAPGGLLETAPAIELIHKAGGKAFWAHPLTFSPEPEQLEPDLDALKALGLDGMEAHYAKYSNSQRQALCRLAGKYDLPVCAGTDFHGGRGPGSRHCGIKMPRQDWNRFRSTILAGQAFSSEADVSESISPPLAWNLSGKPHHFRRRSYLLRILLPTLFAISLFLAFLWGILMPSFERSLFERKRETILELTNSAWSILASYEKDEQNGLLSRQEAQELAAARIEALRYGPDGKGYFWIQDLQPRMIMHPYRTDLNEQDLSDFTDPRGVPIFVEFANLVRQEGEGYIDYVWQWQDDPDRLEPKQSFIKGFAPWGWIIGTGIYMDDVQVEIQRIEQSMVNASLVISGVLVVLLLFVLGQSLRIERQRQEVLDDLHASTERYHALVNATSEGMLLILDGRFRYANPTFVELIGHPAQQLEFFELEDLLPHLAENQPIWTRFESDRSRQPSGVDACKGFLQHANGSLVECVLGLNPIRFARQQGFILLARDITRPGYLLAEEGVARASTPEEIARSTGRLPLMVKALLESGVRSRHVTGMLASICDAATGRLLQLAIKELGQPPADFAFIAMGSQGRQEQTLVTDQDNGIIYILPAGANPHEVQEYFLFLGRYVCEGLHLAGYSFCRGGVMASNPRWCRPLPEWIANFDDWIRTSEAQEIINLSISFDLRTVYGNASLTRELRRAVHTSLNDTPAVFHHLAQNAMQFKSPFHLVGNIYLSGGATEHSGEINLKDAMMPMVSFARLYALRHLVQPTHTLERIESLIEQEILGSSVQDDITASYDLLMQLRLQTQAEAILSGQSPTNLIRPESLSDAEKVLLNQSFAQIAAVQKRIGYDFLGGSQAV